MMAYVLGVLIFLAATVLKIEATGKCKEELDRIDAIIDEERRIGVLRPQCLPDGTYKAKQCMGSVCYCVGSEGNELMKNKINIGLAVDMDCNCLRDLDDYSKLKIIGKMYRCEANGNYSPVQCTGSVCFCADRQGKQIGDQSVHIAMMHELSC